MVSKELDKMAANMYMISFYGHSYYPKQWRSKYLAAYFVEQKEWQDWMAGSSSKYEQSHRDCNIWNLDTNLFLWASTSFQKKDGYFSLSLL